MKKSEIKVGGYYIAKVSDRITTVKVLRIIGSEYHVLNTATNRETVFRTAARFRSEAVAPSGQKKSPLPVTNPEEEKEIAAARREAESRPIPSFAIDTALKGQRDASPHVIIIARAGTGKTTTGITGLEVLKGRKPKITPSPQQRLIWDEFAKSKDATSIAMVAFNKSIAEELQRRVPAGVQAMTLHSHGFKAVLSAFGRQQPNDWVVADAISEIEKKDIREIRKHDFEAVKATEKLVGLAKQNLIGWDGETFDIERVTDDDLGNLAAHYDIDLNGSAGKVFGWTRACLERALEPKGKITFDDMIWLPIVKNLSVNTFDLLFVDEAQDLNRCQQALAMKSGRRLMFCGDDKQAIYGFAGADSESLNRLAETLAGTDRGVTVLPLTVTRRCGKAIVREAQEIVPDFDAHEENGEGVISRAKFRVQDDLVSEPKANLDYRSSVESGDMVLCRVNAPLVSECFRFLKSGRKATIQGRDVGAGLISTIKKLNAVDIVDLSAKLSDWFAEETKKEQSKRMPNEARLINLQDRYDCLCCFVEDQKTVEAVIEKIKSVFTDDKDSPGIRLSSIHRAKGLESRRVFLLEPEGATVPHPMAKSAWQKGQEMNLRYVAITRAIEELVYVS